MERPEISPWLPVYLAALLLLLPLQWVFAWVTAAVLHELGHYCALRLLGIPIRHFTAGINGAKLITGQTDPLRELLAALAGPAVGIGLISLAGVFPRLALCGAVQSAYNLLPVYPMDGGRAVRCIVELLGIKAADKVCATVEILCLAALACLGIYGSFVLRLGLLPLLVCLFPAGKKMFLQR